MSYSPGFVDKVCMHTVLLDVCGLSEKKYNILKFENLRCYTNQTLYTIGYLIFLTYPPQYLSVRVFALCEKSNIAFRSTYKHNDSCTLHSKIINMVGGARLYRKNDKVRFELNTPVQPHPFIILPTLRFAQLWPFNIIIEVQLKCNIKATLFCGDFAVV